VAYDPIWEDAVEITSDLIRRLFGSLGCQEFVIDDVRYVPEHEIWKIRLTRKITDTNVNYEVTIDNLTGRPTRFRKT